MRIGTKLAAVAGGLVLTAMPLATASAAPASSPSQRQVAGAHAKAAGGVSAAAAKYCRSNNHGAYVCFQPYGDKMWVKDTRRDGYSAAAYSKTSYGRKDVCINSLGAGKWGVCDYNMREGKRITFWAVNVKVRTNTYRYWSTDRVTTI